MKVHIICPVTNVTLVQQQEIDVYVGILQAQGHTVHNPRYAVNQNDPTGYEICKGHLTAMRQADEVHVFWDSTSKGSHFDLGMAFVLGKTVRVVKLYHPDIEGKSYVKVMEQMKEKQPMLTKQIPVEDGGLVPRKHAIAYCSIGFLGLILSETLHEVTYNDGNKGMAWTGIQLQHDTRTAVFGKEGKKTVTVHAGDSWSSRTPRVIGYLEDFSVNLIPVVSENSDADFSGRGTLSTEVAL
jgi:hypothetical protein